MSTTNKIEYLSDLEAEAIVRFNLDPIMREAVKKVLLAGIYENGTLLAGRTADPRRNWALSFGTTEDPKITDEMIGQNVRAYAWGINTIEAAFSRLATVQTSPVPNDEKKKKNPAL